METLDRHPGNGGTPSAVERRGFSPLDTARRTQREQVAHLSDDELSATIRDALARGRSCGLTWELTLAGFVARWLERGRDFDLQPEAQRAWQRVAAAPRPDVESFVTQGL